MKNRAFSVQSTFKLGTDESLLRNPQSVLRQSNETHRKYDYYSNYQPEKHEINRANRNLKRDEYVQQNKVVAQDSNQNVNSLQRFQRDSSRSKNKVPVSSKHKYSEPDLLGYEITERNPSIKVYTENYDAIQEGSSCEDKIVSMLETPGKDSAYLETHQPTSNE